MNKSTIINVIFYYWRYLIEIEALIFFTLSKIIRKLPNILADYEMQILLILLIFKNSDFRRHRRLKIM